MSPPDKPSGEKPKSTAEEQQPITPGAEAEGEKAQQARAEAVRGAQEAGAAKAEADAAEAEAIAQSADDDKEPGEEDEAGKPAEASAKGAEDEGKKPAEAESAMRTAAEGGVWSAAFWEKFADKLGKLADKIAAWFEKMFSAFSPKFPNSPIGGDKKLLVTKPYQEGQGIELKPEDPSQKTITWVAKEKGKVLEAGADKLVVAYGDKKIVYTGVTATVAKDAEVAPGAELGTLTGQKLNLQMTDKEGAQQDPTPLLEKFITVPEPAEAPEFKVEQLPLKLEGGAKLEISKKFETPAHPSMEIKAGSGKAVQMISDGIVTNADADWVEITCKDGVVIRYSGLKSAPRISANPSAVIKAGEKVGETDDSGLLTIQITVNGESKDPASFAGLETAAASAPAAAPAAVAPTATPTAPAATPSAAAPATTPTAAAPAAPPAAPSATSASAPAPAAPSTSTASSSH